MSRNRCLEILAIGAWQLGRSIAVGVGQGRPSALSSVTVIRSHLWYVWYVSHDKLGILVALSHHIYRGIYIFWYRYSRSRGWSDVQLVQFIFPGEGLRLFFIIAKIKINDYLVVLLLPPPPLLAVSNNVIQCYSVLLFNYCNVLPCTGRCSAVFLCVDVISGFYSVHFYLLGIFSGWAVSQIQAINDHCHCVMVSLCTVLFGIHIRYVKWVRTITLLPWLLPC